jgi:hypothetical protein
MTETQRIMEKLDCPRGFKVAFEEEPAPRSGDGDIIEILAQVNRERSGLSNVGLMYQSTDGFYDMLVVFYQFSTRKWLAVPDGFAVKYWKYWDKTPRGKNDRQ